MRAKKIMQEATGKDDFGTAADMFENLWNYKDSEELRKICVERFNAAVECEKNYLSGVKLLEQGTENNSIANINDALGYFVRVRGFKDAEKKITICNDTIAKIKWVEAKKEEERKREYKINIAYTVVAVVLAIAIGVFIYGAWPNIQYRRAVKLYNTGSYSEAIEALNKISGESFSEQQITNADNMKQIVEIYYDAVNYYIDKNYKAAYSEFLKVKDFRNSTSGFLEPAYQEATKLWNDGDLEKAYSIFIDLGKYKDSAENALKIKSDMQR